MKRIILLSLIFLSLVGYAQISTEEEPISFQYTNNELSRMSPQSTRKLAVRTNYLKKLTSPNLNKLKQEDIRDEQNGLPPRFGAPMAVNYNLQNSGKWLTLPDGDKLWQLEIQSKGALSLNLLYDKFWLPEGTKFFIYSKDKKHTLGAFTAVNNKGSKNNLQGFATGLIYSDDIILEYYQPKNIADKGIINIAYVVYGYKYIRIKQNKSFNSSGNCHFNINCSEGSDWEKEKNAVALILVNGHRYCTGSLINNTAKNKEPLFLTADHCLGGWATGGVKYDAINNPNLSHWSFCWNYETPNCLGISEPPLNSTVGATILANNESTDFALLKLAEDPKNKKKVKVYYLGWDRVTTYIGNEGACIHHPSGDVKKISFYKTPPRSTYYLQDNINNNGTHWKIVWDKGVTEGGSSGSPLLNKSKRIIGQLHGGYSSCTEKNSPDWYGRFDVSWTGNDNPDKRRRLKDWLDPYNTKQQTLDGIDYIPPVPYKLTITNTMPWGFCKKAIFKVENFPLDEKNATIDWKFPLGSRITKEIAKNEVEIDFATNYSAEVHAIVNTKDYRNLNLEVIGMNNNYVRSDMLCMQLEKEKDNKYKMNFVLDSLTIRPLTPYQRRKIINVTTNNCVLSSKSEQEYLEITGSNPLVKATITLAPETCSDEPITFHLKNLTSNFIIVPTEESKLLDGNKPENKTDTCDNPEEIKGEVLSNGWYRARTYYFDFYEYQSPDDQLDIWVKYKTSAPTSRVSTGYFEIVPAKGYITAHSPMKIQATPNGAELFIDSPQYIGYQEWGKAWIRYVPEDCKASKWELWDFSKAGYATNGYFAYRDKNYASTNFYMYPNPSSNTVFLSVKPQTESRRGVSLFSAQKHALQNEPYQIEMFNTAGVRVLHQEGKGTIAEFSVAHLPAGIYIVHFTQNGVTHKEKLIVE